LHASTRKDLNSVLAPYVCFPVVRLYVQSPNRQHRYKALMGAYTGTGTGTTGTGRGTGTTGVCRYSRPL
jgi:hypothetical protein